VLRPDQLFRLINELIFVLLGGLLGWVATTGRLYFDRRSVTWIAVSAAMILWGLRALYLPAQAGRPGQWWARRQNLTRGLSLILVGVILLAIAHVPLGWVAPLLGAAAGVLVLRGIVSTILVFQMRS
jgi:hypothetical protein